MGVMSVMRVIQVMVKAEIERCPTLTQIGDKLLEKCANNANGMFLWARLMLDWIKEAPSLKIQLKRLTTFPPGLDAVYHQFLEQKSQVLDSVHLRLRRELFCLITGSLRFLTLFEIDEALTLDVYRISQNNDNRILDIEAKIIHVCGPLVVVTDGVVVLIHASVKEYLIRDRKSPGTSTMFMNLDSRIANQWIVDRCLCMLMLPKFGENKVITAILRKSVGLEDVEDSKKYTLLESDSSIETAYGFYRYSALHWHLHLTALPKPTRATLELVARFFQSKQLVTWSETLFLLGSGSHGSPAMEVASYLNSWLVLQNPSTRETIKMNHFMETPYSDLAQEFEKTNIYPLEHAFLNSRFAEYFAWTGNLSDKGFQLLVQAAESLESQLGPTHQMTLSAQDALATGALVRGLHKVAAASHAHICEERRRTLGPNHQDVYMSMSYQCLSNFHLLNFEKAQKFGEKAAAGLLSTSLPSMKGFLHNQLYLGYALEGQNKVEEAMKLYESAYSLWMKLNGPNDPSTLMTQSAMASTYRKIGRLADAERHYTICFAGRQRAVGLDNYVCIDLAVSLSYVYYELGRTEEAWALLELVSPLDALTKTENFERACQIKHLQALITYKESPTEAQRQLSDILDVANNIWPPANRETMWIRLTLAGWLRRNGEVEQALALFENITRPQQDATITPEKRIDITEIAVRYMKSAAVGKARELLQNNGLEWVRGEDFEIIHGGPLTDTAWERCLEAK